MGSLICTACSSDGGGDEPADAGPDDAGPWIEGELTCAHDPMVDYETRTYSFADGFDRRDLGPNWHSGVPEAWSVIDDATLIGDGETEEPGTFALVSDGQVGTEIVAWVDVTRDQGWDGAPAVLCRADGPPMTAGYGVRVRASEMELFEQSGAGPGRSVETMDLPSALADVTSIRLVVGCTAGTLTAFAYSGVGVDSTLLGCLSWGTGDEPRSGAVALTHEAGRTAFDNVRVELTR